MQILKENKNFSIYIGKYLGVALIAGSVVHIGTLQNGFARYIVLLIVGLCLIAIGNALEAKENGEKINLRYLLLITGLSFGTGFLSGGVQHYLDNPSYAGTLLGVGLTLAYVTYFIKDNLKLKPKNIIIVLVLSVSTIVFSNYFMDDEILGESHHAKMQTEISDKI